jgi:hypothetical protein
MDKLEVRTFEFSGKPVEFQLLLLMGRTVDFIFLHFVLEKAINAMQQFEYNHVSSNNMIYHLEVTSYLKLKIQDSQ